MSSAKYLEISQVLGYNYYRYIVLSKLKQLKQIFKVVYFNLSILLSFRRQKKIADRSTSEDNSKQLKSSSEISLNTVSTSVPVRTTRTSRLRAAAASNLECSTSRKSNRSSSDTSLIDDIKNKTNRNSKIVERDKIKVSTNKRQSNAEKENCKSTSTTCFNEIGAIKSKHSNNKNLLDKDKSKKVVNSNRLNANIDGHNGLSAEKIDNLNLQESLVISNVHNGIENKLLVNGDGCENIAQKELLENDIKVKHDNLNSKLNTNGKVFKVNCNSASDDSESNNYSGNINIDYETQLLSKDKVTTTLKNDPCESALDKSANRNEGGLLGAVCVRKVERFSELLSNLCSPNEADLLFEDILADSELDVGAKPVRYIFLIQHI